MFSFKKFKNQKGAMFGLDARVALAIFGGLSVIAGAAVISSITETNVTALTTEFDNISKGYINQVFDTGVDTVTFNDLLADSGAVSWNGPYLTIANDNQVRFGTYSLGEGPDAAAANPTGAACVGICYVWLELTQVPTPIAERIDSQIDGAVDAANGNFRYVDTAGVSVTRYKLSRCQGPGPCV
ncbi:MAG: hypothetical protein VX730_03020 [Pseudomonadota bacterium]|nr:hypothetical protein [Pseudomonadota bacterium]